MLATTMINTVSSRSLADSPPNQGRGGSRGARLVRGRGFRHARSLAHPPGVSNQGSPQPGEGGAPRRAGRAGPGARGSTGLASRAGRDGGARAQLAADPRAKEGVDQGGRRAAEEGGGDEGAQPELGQGGGDGGDAQWRDGEQPDREQGGEGVSRQTAEKARRAAIPRPRRSASRPTPPERPGR